MVYEQTEEKRFLQKDGIKKQDYGFEAGILFFLLSFGVAFRFKFVEIFVDVTVLI